MSRPVLYRIVFLPESPSGAPGRTYSTADLRASLVHEDGTTHHAQVAIDPKLRGHFRAAILRRQAAYLAQVVRR